MERVVGTCVNQERLSYVTITNTHRRTEVGRVGCRESCPIRARKCQQRKNEDEHT